MSRVKKGESIGDKLQAVPSETFWKEGSPNYNAVFVWFVREFYAGPQGVRVMPEDAEVFLKDMEEGSIVNLTTFTRAVAIEADRRRKAGEDKFEGQEMKLGEIQFVGGTSSGDIIGRMKLSAEYILKNPKPDDPCYQRAEVLADDFLTLLRQGRVK